jgi:TRAP-type C4-dicarboxylate transport system substrate-binding protein
MRDQQSTRRKTLKYLGTAVSATALAGCGGDGGDGGDGSSGGSDGGDGSSGGSDGGDGGSSTEGSQQEFELVWTDHFPPGDFRPLDVTSRRFMDAVEEKSGGQVTFDYRPGGELGGSDQTMSLVQSGAADVGHIVPSYYSDIVPYTPVGDLPAMGQDILPPSKAIHDLLMPHRDGQLAEVDWEPQGIRPLLTNVSGQYNVASAVGPIETAEDLEGLNVRTGGGPAAAQAQALGASPVNMGAAEIYQAFERGTIEADMNGYEIWEGFGIYEVLEHVTRNTPLVRNTLFEGINLDTWNSLPDDMQELFIEESNKNPKSFADALSKYAEEATVRFEEEYDIPVYELPSEERSRWEEAQIEGVVEPWIDDKPDPELADEILTKYQEGIEEYQ